MRDKPFAVLVFGVLVAVLLCAVPALAQNETAPPPPPPDYVAGLKGEYFDNLDFTNLKLTRTDPTVDFNWAAGSPDPSIGPETFSVRWTGQVKADYSQTYTFYATGDDYVRLYVNNQLVADKWATGLGTPTGTIALQAGQWYDIKMEYGASTGNAAAKLEYSSPSEARKIIPQSNLRSVPTGAQPPPPPPPPDETVSGLKGDYYDNLDFTNLKVARTDPTVNYGWGAGSPDSSIGVDTFSVRWVGDVKADRSEPYTFYITADDYIRVWVGGNLVIDRWTTGLFTNSANIAMAAGEWKPIRIEYGASTGNAKTVLEYSSPSTPRQVIPQSNLRSAHVGEPPPPPPPPPGEPIAIGAYISNAPWSPSALDQYNQMVGTNVKVVNWFQDWANNPAFQPWMFDAVNNRGAMPMLTWEPFDYRYGVNQPDYQLQDIINGQHDTVIRNWARATVIYGKPYYLRFAHEMNGNWTAWSSGVNGNGAPSQYAQAWRHVHDIFAQEGANQYVTWVWCPNVTQRLPELHEFYPGDAYVDWTCMDGYNWGTTTSEGWRSMDSIFRSTHDRILQFAPTKPMMIGETGSAEQGGDKAAWIRQSYYTDLPQALPKVRAVVWFDALHSADWRVNTSPRSLAAYSEVAKDPRYQGVLP